MAFLSSYRCVLTSVGLSLLLLVPTAARADDIAAPAKIDLARENDLPAYPDGAKDRNEKGDTVLAISVSARGIPTKIAVETSSGFGDLDDAAVAAAWRWYFEPGSDGRKDVASVLKVTVHFRLSPLPKPPITETEAYALTDMGDTIVCKTPPPAIGSNITPPRVCMAKREWDKAAEQAKRTVIPAMRGDINPGHRPGF